ncbi:hypothetical protein [Bosea sp. (in: a-proteobacteria)]|uniref:c-type cytochrome n=1 Tax=Bosea sp. (in: a-proteobacteria) TaxID=1871050 RepID=UPI0026167AE2|nr:hypothetical protein [Bosea sp. (in: a-proteobacteria)]MCO5091335.1 hypothetical protein [Bosea sp. (in: a-proteobacteria)]
MNPLTSRFSMLPGYTRTKAYTREGCSCSAAMRASGLISNAATFTEYIQNPRRKARVTKMIHAGLEDEKRAAGLLAYLKQFDAIGKRRKNPPWKICRSSSPSPQARDELFLYNQIFDWNPVRRFEAKLDF